MPVGGNVAGRTVAGLTRRPSGTRLARALHGTAHMTSLTLATFLDPLALGIVGGGTLAAAVLRTPLPDFGRGLAALGVLHRRRPFEGDRALVATELAHGLTP